MGDVHLQFKPQKLWGSLLEFVSTLRTAKGRTLEIAKIEAAQGYFFVYYLDRATRERKYSVVRRLVCYYGGGEGWEVVADQLVEDEDF